MYDNNYSAHVKLKFKNTLDVINKLHFDKLIISSGDIQYRFRDDLYYPFQTNSYFIEWLPISRPNSFIVIDASQTKPQLYIQRTDDYWDSAPTPLPEAIYAEFEVIEYQSIEKLRKKLSNTINAAVLDSTAVSQWPDNTIINPEPLLTYLDYYRGYKSEWQIDCISKANQLAAKGHKRAKQLFEKGVSELEIHLGYLAAIKCAESELPYDNIICLNEHCAVLHHMKLSKAKPSNKHSMLIDAGAPFQGLTADVTRTYSARPGLFQDLIDGLDKLQQNIVANLTINSPYAQHHASAELKIAELLIDSSIVKTTATQAVESGLTRTFFPHGLGHLLGVQVHDKGGHLSTPEGDIINPPKDYPNLRLTRPLTKNQTFTIEPGIYFIKPLLDKAREGKQAQYIDWSLVNELMPYGGIRIEDNIVLLENGAKNLTREAFDS